MGGGSSNPHQTSGSYSWVDAGCRESLHRRTNGVGDPARASQPFPVSADGQRADRTASSVSPSPTGWSAYDPGTVRAAGRARRWPRTETWHPQPRRGAWCAGRRRTVRGGGGEERNRHGEHALAAPTPVRSPGPTGRCDPWGAIARGRILTWGQVLAPASRTFHSALNPTGTRCRQCRMISSPCQHLRPPADRLRFNSDAWSRGTVISIGSGAVGMLWDRGRTTGQAGPV